MRTDTRMRSWPAIMILLVFLLPHCCTRSADQYYQYSLNDPELLPYAAMYEVDREEYCLSEIDPDSRVSILISDDNEGPDAVLDMRSDDWTYRSIAFVWEGGRYVWIGEGETHYSGRTYETPDGILPEEITIEYNDREVGYWGPAGLFIWYHGPDESLLDLTCERAWSVIQAWEENRKKNRP